MHGHAEIEAKTLKALIALVHHHTGIAMTERKSALLQGRLRPRLRALGLSVYEHYLALLQTDRSEVQVFINMVTTNDTIFFRTPHIWDYFCQEFLPAWCASHAGETFKVWSAAAASGEEAYSIAMLCDEFQEKHPAFKYQIIATDISTDTLAAAQAGVYAGRSVQRMQQAYPRLFSKYFSTHAKGYSIDSRLKSTITFAEHNLLGPLNMPHRFDLVFLRNVLIYFDEINQEKVVREVRKSMKDSAHLIVGESESLARLNTCYAYHMPLIYGVTSVAAG